MDHDGEIPRGRSGGARWTPSCFATSTPVDVYAVVTRPSDAWSPVPAQARRLEGRDDRLVCAISGEALDECLAVLLGHVEAVAPAVNRAVGGAVSLARRLRVPVMFGNARRTSRTCGLQVMLSWRRVPPVLTAAGVRKPRRTTRTPEQLPRRVRRPLRTSFNPRGRPLLAPAALSVLYQSRPTRRGTGRGGRGASSRPRPSGAVATAPFEALGLPDLDAAEGEVHGSALGSLRGSAADGIDEAGHRVRKLAKAALHERDRGL